MIPKIYAHRGASADFPEHTRAAYLAAIEQGVDGFECDLRLTKDAVPILWHDSNLKRNAGLPGDVAGLTYSEIKRKFKEVMTFTEILDIAIANKKNLAIESKHPVPTGREIEKSTVTILKERASEISKSGIDVSLMSFSWLAIESIKSEVNTVFLFNSFFSGPGRRFTSANALGPSIEKIKANPEIIKEARSSGKKLFVWTVDIAKDVEFCAQNEIDVVITNKPAQARKVLGYP